MNPLPDILKWEVGDILTDQSAVYSLGLGRVGQPVDLRVLFCRMGES